MRNKYEVVECGAEDNNIAKRLLPGCVRGRASYSSIPFSEEPLGTPLKFRVFGIYTCLTHEWCRIQSDRDQMDSKL